MIDFILEYFVYILLFAAVLIIDVLYLIRAFRANRAVKKMNRDFQHLGPIHQQLADLSKLVNEPKKTVEDPNDPFVNSIEDLK